MSLEKATILLERINALHKGIQKDGHLSTIEQDLMKSYIRQLYECYLDIKEQPQRVKPTPVSVPSFETEMIRKTPEPSPSKDHYKPPRIIEVKEQPRKEVVLPPPPPEPKPKVEAREPVYIAPPVIEPIITKAPTAISKEINALFEAKKAKELSERLSESPIRDLTKAIALNDKLLFSNELFSGALVTFNEVIRSLNDMTDRQDAESYLMELAKQHNWTTDAKVPIAKGFIKLVRRRFA